jgi:hypothetical protein
MPAKSRGAPRRDCPNELAQLPLLDPLHARVVERLDTVRLPDEIHAFCAEEIAREENQDDLLSPVRERP